jgi:hypothetical protein
MIVKQFFPKTGSTKAAEQMHTWAKTLVNEARRIVKETGPVNEEEAMKTISAAFHEVCVAHRDLVASIRRL